MLTNVHAVEQNVIPSCGAGNFVVDQFERMAARRPDLIAIEFGSALMTYREIDARANRLARHLVSLGVGPEIVVGIHLDASPEMVIGMIAVLKAGSCYLPLDTTYPAARIIQMLEDAEASVLLTRADRMDDLPVRGLITVPLDQEAEVIAAYPAVKPRVRVDPDNTAYVIYTSGSSGKPKGVMATLGSLTNLVNAQQKAFFVQPGTRVLQFSSPGFDAAVSEIWVSLCAGALLIIEPSVEARVGKGLLKVLQDRVINLVTLPPSVLATVPESALAALQVLVVAGEACSQRLISRWLGGRRCLNAYGPTETTVCASIGQIRADQPKPSIGVAMDGATVHLLDAGLQPASIGVAGEIYIGGAGVARGYCRRPDLTGERFLPDTQSDCPGARCYRSGDIGRRQSNGEIEYVGRTDFQVKIRGFRIELEEVQSLLSSHPEVARSAITVSDEEGDSKRLVAHVIRSESSGVSATDLRAFLETRLPAFMIPASFIFHSEFPITVNGKLDRRALAAMPIQEMRCLPDRPYVAPRSDLEAKVASLWAEVLSLERVSVEDDFFDLGGHSILLTQLASRIWEEFQVEISLRVLFDAPSVVKMSEAILARRMELADPDDMKRMLNRLRQLSPEQVKEVMAGRTSDI